jgi:hypothetical protein
MGTWTQIFLGPLQVVSNNRQKNTRKSIERKPSIYQLISVSIGEKACMEPKKREPRFTDEKVEDH